MEEPDKLEVLELNDMVWVALAGRPRFLGASGYAQCRPNRAGRHWPDQWGRWQEPTAANAGIMKGPVVDASRLDSVPLGFASRCVFLTLLARHNEQLDYQQSDIGPRENIAHAA